MVSNSENHIFTLETTKLAVIGLGYVGLPLAVEFGKYRSVVGFDIQSQRIKELKNGFDNTLEVDTDELKKSEKLVFSNDIADIADCNVYIVTVPTPIDEKKRPDLGPLLKASKTIGTVLKRGDVVIYESTVYPGATEEDCVPVLESESELKFNIDFYAGYSPERINPGDKDHRLTNITKVTSGSTPEVAEFVDSLYASIIDAGTHKAESIRVAEAAKVIENTQRDLNIALINELALIFNKMDIDTEAVLDAAGTKWNFLPFSPGLVGGHCIGVDPYYLTHKALEVGYKPEMILAGRKINDNMSIFIADQVSKLMLKKGISIEGSNILIMGLSFKENCPDIRNTKVVDLVNEFKSFRCNIDVYDPWVDKDEALNEYNMKLIEYPEKDKYDAIVLAVAHDQFQDFSYKEIMAFGKDKHVIYDIKYLLNIDEVDGRL